MILVLARGHFCPKDNQQHLRLAALQPEIAVAYTRIVMISTDTVVVTREFRNSVGATWTTWPIRPGGSRRTSTSRSTPDPAHDPMIPHTLVLKPGLVIHSIYDGYWYWGRPTDDDLRRDLRAVTREIRPDWDLSAPGLREEWEAGDKTRFFYDEDLDPRLNTHH
jgi:hypothetical protein